jgi:hypothetical protein
MKFAKCHPQLGTPLTPLYWLVDDRTPLHAADGLSAFYDSFPPWRGRLPFS